MNLMNEIYRYETQRRSVCLCVNGACTTVMAKLLQIIDKQIENSIYSIYHFARISFIDIHSLCVWVGVNVCVRILHVHLDTFMGIIESYFESNSCPLFFYLPIRSLDWVEQNDDSFDSMLIGMLCDKEFVNSLAAYFYLSAYNSMQKFRIVFNNGKKTS